MKKLSIFSCLLYLSLCGCITEYEAERIDEVKDILVVEGVITDNETVITLSRSVNISDESYPVYIDNADVYVECDDGTLMQAEPYDYFSWGGVSRNGRYIIKTGKLNLNNKYCLKIEIDEHKYYSDFSYPIQTPEIDSIFWRKRGRGQPVMLYVATHEPEQKVAYYRWSYREDWEIHAHIQAAGFPYYCWSSSSNNDLLLGSTEKTVYGQLADVLTEIESSDRRLSKLYRIIVKQNVVSKRAHDYYTNIRKNSQLNGSIFAPTPSELRGNIACITDPERPVIGYVEVSTTAAKKQRFISRSDNLYEYEPPSNIECTEYSLSALLEKYRGTSIPYFYVPLIVREGSEPFYINIQCVDCRVLQLGNTTQKPDDWPR